jgi:predicted DNA-binding antitoxin AbrB/MazE fold protein
MLTEGFGMSQTIEAVYDGAVLRPVSALSLKPNTRVRITLEVLPLKEAAPTSFLRTARSLNLSGPADWSANLDNYLYGNGDQTRG